MKIRVERDALTDAVTWVSRSLPNRPPSPILAGIRLVADPSGHLNFSAFDYEVSARLDIPAEIGDAGKTLVNGRLLADICRSLPNKPVDLHDDGQRITVACGSSRFALPMMPVDEYPNLPPMPDTAGTVAGDAFALAVSQVTIAASKDDTLPILTGVRIEIADDTLTMMATDRYRLALRELPWRSGTSDTEAVALVRARTLSEAAKSLGAAGTDVTLALSTESTARMIGFAANGRQTTSLLLDGDYPKVRKLFPTDVPVHAVVHTAQLLESVRRVALVAERNAPVRLSFTEGQAVLEAGQGEEAQASEVVEATLTGEPISTAFNPQFLIDGLAALHHPFVRLSFTQPSQPAVMTGQAEADGPDNADFRYLLMPVRFAN